MFAITPFIITTLMNMTLMAVGCFTLFVARTLFGWRPANVMSALYGLAFDVSVVALLFLCTDPLVKRLKTAVFRKFVRTPAAELKEE